MDEQLIRETHASLSTEELLEIISSPRAYTALAIQIATEELTSRQVSEKERADFKRNYAKVEQLLNTRNIVDDLSVLQKLFFYFLWPRRISGKLRNKFSQNGFILKTWQSNYYSFTGFLGFALALAGASNSVILALLIWIIMLLSVLAFDKLFNLKRQQRKLARLESEGTLDLEW